VPRQSAFCLILGLVLGLIAALSPQSALGQDAAQDIREEIRETRQQAESVEQDLARLTDEERALYGDLAALEKRVRSLEAEVRELEKALADVEGRQSTAASQGEDIEARRAETAARVDELLTAMWQVHHRNLQATLSSLQDWSETDRLFTWLAALYADARAALEELRRQTEALAANLTEQQALADEQREALAALNRKKDAVLKDKLGLVKAIQEVRAERIGKEEQVEALMAAVEGLNYQLKSLTERRFPKLKGYLPWPVPRDVVEVVAGYSPGSSPPVRGLGLAVPEGETVRAVSWGKVVHAELLRGFGEVVILMHGDNYYTLYAYLSETRVKVGQEVERGEALGQAGYYPAAKTSGMYFELRSGKKAVNPLDWLASLS
jgi:septal ring factor EnvC (AmiA/AmiB activator)